MYSVYLKTFASLFVKQTNLSRAHQALGQHFYMGKKKFISEIFIAVNFSLRRRFVLLSSINPILHPISITSISSISFSH